MEIANVRVRLNKDGSDVPVKDVTPAEAMFLHILHGANCNGQTYGEDFSKIEVVGTAMIDTGTRKKVVTKEAVAQAVQKGKLVTPAQPERLIPGKVVTEAKSAVGQPGTPGFVPAVAEVREPTIKVLAVPAVYEPDTIIAAQPEEFRLEPVLRERTDAEELSRLVKKYNGAKNKQNKPIILEVWTDRLNPKLPQKFSDINWKQVNEMFGNLEPVALNYATGSPAQTALPIA